MSADHDQLKRLINHLIGEKLAMAESKLNAAIRGFTAAMEKAQETLDDISARLQKIEATQPASGDVAGEITDLQTQVDRIKEMEDDPDATSGQTQSAPTPTPAAPTPASGT